jgi:hypothetical protein
VWLWIGLDYLVIAPFQDGMLILERIATQALTAEMQPCLANRQRAGEPRGHEHEPRTTWRLSYPPRAAGHKMIENISSPVPRMFLFFNTPR